MTWQDFYAHVTNPYGASGPFYGSAGHHGVDFAAAPHQAIPSYFTGTLVLNAHSSVLGNYSVYKVGTTYRGFAHLLIGSRRNVGDKVKPGDTIGKAAAAGDDHGSAWRGSHCHTTRSNFVTGITDGRTLNPAPGIAAARRASSTAPAKPAPKPTATKTVTVKAGDTLGKIASANGTTVPKILALPQSPKITNPDIIKIGQRIRVN